MLALAAFSPIPFIMWALFIAIVVAVACQYAYQAGKDAGYRSGLGDGYYWRIADERDEQLADWSAQRRPSGCRRHGSDDHA